MQRRRGAGCMPTGGEREWGGVGREGEMRPPAPFVEGRGGGKRMVGPRQKARTYVWRRMHVSLELGLPPADDLFNQPRVVLVAVGLELLAQEVALVDPELAMHRPIHQALEALAVQPLHAQDVGRRHIRP